MRILLRRLHLWLSLALGLPLVLIALSGAPLVWRDAFDRLIAPARYAITGDALLAPSVYAASARAAAGEGYALHELRYPKAAGWPLKASLRPVEGAAKQARAVVVSLDPATGKALDVAGVSDTVVGFLHNFHHMLMLPQIGGRQIVGWFGVVLLFLAVSGLVLWWPRNNRVLLGLRWRRAPGLAGNLHHLFGFWIALPLSVVSLTGIYLAFPETASMLTKAMTGEALPSRHGMFSARPVARLNLSPDVVLDKALALAPGARVATLAAPLALPGHQGHGAVLWRVSLRAPDGHHGRSVQVQDESGAAAFLPEPAAGVAAGQTFKALHEGHRFGPLWAVLVFLTGVLPLLFLVTGVLMWLRRRAASAA